MTETWPASVPYAPLETQLMLRLPYAGERTEWEQGPARVVRRATRAPTGVELGWDLMREEYEILRAWYRHRLNDGERRFTFPLYTGNQFREVSCRFREAPRPATRRGAGLWRFAAKLDAAAVPTDPLEDIEAAWRDELDYRPDPDSLRVTPHEPLLRSEGELGPTAVRRRFASPAALEQDWVFDLDDMEIFRAWWDRALFQGVRWFEVPVWTGEAYEPAIARFREGAEARLEAGVQWRVGGRLELRELPSLSDLELTAIDAAPSLHHLVHVVLPAALPA